MPTLLERAIGELKALPPDTQEAFAADVLDMLKSEHKWDELFADPRSEALFDRMAKKVRANIAAGKAKPGDPSDSDGP